MRDGCSARALLGAARERALGIMALHHPTEEGVAQHVHLMNARSVVRLRATSYGPLTRMGWG
jgi:hypothetical protein